MDIQEVMDAMASPVIVVLCLCVCQIVKRAADDERVSRWLPLGAGVLGVAASCVMATSTGIGTDNAVQVVVTGLVSGLAATGLFELGKSVGGADGE